MSRYHILLDESPLNDLQSHEDALKRMESVYDDVCKQVKTAPNPSVSRAIRDTLAVTQNARRLRFPSAEEKEDEKEQKTNEKSDHNPFQHDVELLDLSNRQQRLMKRQERDVLAPIGDLDCMALFEALSVTVNLSPFRAIDLSFNNIGDAGAKAVAVFLKATKTLEMLNLECNGIGELGTMAIAEALEKQSSLKSLNLNGNPAGDKAVCRLADSLRSNVCLTHLALGNTNAGTQAMVQLSIAIGSYNMYLKSLNIDKPILFSYEEETTLHLANMLKKNISLTSLSMAKHNTRPQGALMLADALRQNGTLETLNLSCNQIDAVGMEHLAEALTPLVEYPWESPEESKLPRPAPSRCAVTELDLSGNRLTDEATGALQLVLSHGTKLKRLDLHNTGLQNDGLTQIAAGLSQNKTLEHIQLAGNLFGAEAQRALRDYLDSTACYLQEPTSVDFYNLVQPDPWIHPESATKPTL